MKKRPKIKVARSSKMLYEGTIIDMPVREDFIIKKSVELFDDDDPCIIHKSYVLKEFENLVVKGFKDSENDILQVQDLPILKEVDFTEIEECTFQLKE